VYTASAGGATADGTATIVVTDVPDIAGDGNVTVSYVHGNLRVLGDKGNNSIQISGDATSITVLGLGNTKINGGTDAVRDFLRQYLQQPVDQHEGW
jgi:hypothetical protein